MQDNPGESWCVDVAEGSQLIRSLSCMDGMENKIWHTLLYSDD